MVKQDEDKRNSGGYFRHAGNDKRKPDGYCIEETGETSEAVPATGGKGPGDDAALRERRVACERIA